MPKASARSKSRRSRSFGGCGTCRRRHVKCDQVRSECLTCKAVGATCEGFSAEIRWMSPKKDGTDKETTPSQPGVSRRHLYTGMYARRLFLLSDQSDEAMTEGNREQMSASMVASFPIGTVDASLTEIDNKCKHAANNVDITLGPFSVLNFSNKQVEEETSEPGQDGGRPDLTAAEQPQLLDNVTPITKDSWMGLDDGLQWADLFGFGADGLFQPPDSVFDPLIGMNNSPMLLQQDVQACTNHSMFDTGYHALAGTGSRITAIDHSSITLDDMFAEAQMLLKHFKDNVITRFSNLPFPAKSSWEILNLTEAVNSLAHLTFLASTTVSCAKKANLFSILATSSHHLATNPSYDVNISRQSGNWSQYAKVTASEAKHNMQQSLKQELHGPSKAKYKDQLMAIESLLALTVIAGQQKDARCYLMDAERLMRHRGLAKGHISRKSRLLHHMYTWSRIVGESTYVLHEHAESATAHLSQWATSVPPLRQARHSTIHATGPGSRLDDFLRLDPPPTDNDLEIKEGTEGQIALHDIHLKDSRDNTDTMYNEIYGISETWLSLLSHTTRLANRMDGIRATGNSDPALDNLLQRRAARIEDMVCSYAAQFVPRSNEASRVPNNHMHSALNSALVIFFYRRIRNVNPWILQSHVDDVITALENFDQSILDRAWDGPGSPWPAFVAGGEASTPGKRDRLLKWLDKGVTMTGFSTYAGAQELLLEVRSRRDQNRFEGTSSTALRSTGRHSRAAQGTTSWVDICREKKIWVMAF